MDNRQQIPSDNNTSHGLWPGEPKIEKNKNKNKNKTKK